MVAPRGAGVLLLGAPQPWSEHDTLLLASMSTEGMGPSLAVEGATTTAIFEAYVQEVLSPSLRPGQIVVMDNLSAHKGARIRDLVEERDWELLYLPAYSPDLNSIEEALSKIKSILRISRSQEQGSSGGSDGQGA